MSSDDLAGLRLIGETVQPDVAAGEYGCAEVYFEGMVTAGAVDWVGSQHPARRVFSRPPPVDKVLFDGTLDPHGGVLVPDPSAPGHGMPLREADAEAARIR